MKKIVALVVAGVLTVGVLSGCNSESNHNAEKGDRDTGPADVINMPEGFRNVAHKCDGPNMVYVTSRGSGDYANVSTIAVVANDPRCLPK